MYSDFWLPGFLNIFRDKLTLKTLPPKPVCLLIVRNEHTDY